MADVNLIRERWLEPPEMLDVGCVQCVRCGKFHSSKGFKHCSFDCWHLENVGEARRQIECWKNHGYEIGRVLKNMEKHWFPDMSNATVGRYKRAISTEFKNGAIK